MTKVRLLAALGALITGVVVLAQGPVSSTDDDVVVQLRSTSAPVTPVTVGTAPSPVPLTDPRPFDACEDIPFHVISDLGLAFTPPRPEESMRCEFDAGNYQLAVEPVIWRSYAETLPADALETTIGGHRAAEFWVMKPSDWNTRWWVSCMVVFKTSYGVIQQSLYYATLSARPNVDCWAENHMRAEQLAPYYTF